MQDEAAARDAGDTNSVYSLPGSTAAMSASAAGRRARALASRLVVECSSGSVPSVTAVLADGASVNAKGPALSGRRNPSGAADVLPLRAAVQFGSHDIAVLLLSRGADPNGDSVMSAATCWGTPAMLQLLIDAGGDVNRKSHGRPPLFWAIHENNLATLSVLLVQPSLDLSCTFENKSAEQYAQRYDVAAVAELVAQEVRRR